MRVEKDSGFVTGIKCDRCHAEHGGDFVYYSLDARNVTVDAAGARGGVESLPVVTSLDVCQVCMVELSEIVKVHYSPTRVGVNCDLCGAKMRGNFTYFYVNVSRVSVRMSAGRRECAGCRQPVAGDSACRCGSSRFAVVADVSVDNRYLQMASCQADHDRLTEAALALRHKEANNG